VPGLLRFCDGVLLTVDLADAACMDHVFAIRGQLSERRIELGENWPGLPAAVPEAQEDGATLPDPFRVHLPTLLLANKCDLDPDPGEVQVLEELLGVAFPALATSALTGLGLNELAPLLFRALALVRVYTKAPGKAAERARPFTVRRGQTVLDVARLVHQDIADGLKYARLWGSGNFDGQQVGPDHVVADRDVVELHTR
jgi:ribosome-interacting GTPase 1